MWELRKNPKHNKHPQTKNTPNCQRVKMWNSMPRFNSDKGTLNRVKYGARTPGAKFKGRAWGVRTLRQGAQLALKSKNEFKKQKEKEGGAGVSHDKRHEWEWKNIFKHEPNMRIHFQPYSCISSQVYRASKQRINQFWTQTSAERWEWAFLLFSGNIMLIAVFCNNIKWHFTPWAPKSTRT